MKSAKPLGTSQISLLPNTYIYKIEPVPKRLAIISSDDSLRSVDPGTLQIDPDGVRQNAHVGVTCLVHSTLDNCLLTAGRDGFMRSWDTRCSAKVSELGGGKGTIAGVTRFPS